MKANKNKRKNFEYNKKYQDKNKKKSIDMKKTINKSIKEFNNIEENENYILAETNIKEDNINEDIRIINTFEECKRINEWEDEEDDYKYVNEKEIKENCIIKINII